MLAVVLFAAVLVGSAMTFAIWRLNRLTDVPTIPIPAGFDKLVRQIADLDEQLESGKVERADYEVRRAQLKAELAKELGK